MTVASLNPLRWPLVFKAPAFVALFMLGVSVVITNAVLSRLKDTQERRGFLAFVKAAQKTNECHHAPPSRFIHGAHVEVLIWFYTANFPTAFSLNK